MRIVLQDGFRDWEEIELHSGDRERERGGGWRKVLESAALGVPVTWSRNSPEGKKIGGIDSVIRLSLLLCPQFMPWGEIRSNCPLI